MVIESVFESGLLRQQVVGGVGSARRIVPYLRSAGVHRPLLACGARAAATPFVERLSNALLEAFPHLQVIGDVPAPPTVSALEGLLARSEPFDAVIGVGGGSSLDAAKALAIRSGSGGSLHSHAMRRGAAVGAPGDGSKPPLVVAVPATFSGSEANASASIRDAATGERLSLMDPRVLPSLVVLDPDALATQPPALVAASACNALAHCVEAIYSTRHNPVADSLALSTAQELCRLLSEDPSGLRPDGLLRLQICSLFAGALIKEVYVGLHHAICHALVTVCGVQHAVANAAVLPWAVRRNAQDLESARRDLLALAVGAASGTPRALWDRLRQLQASLGQAGALGEMGVAASDLDRIADQTLADRALDTNPVPLEREDILALLRSAL